ncbi:unnamed protein product [Ostreobium quekettii]|uniref:Cyclic nucleotide-binding domain-containing protein n=1 Tax=Ostreobium quekettii TaxID=121088 RepID=A0A8S1IW06_9CHLO|nr:unnamed protein product [Ostreobium quekettii]|eukprot:evm.model.scf_303EXC.4 EVM.evm.TU.scf_303EXC.4   scf_303EXC:60896-66028(-)
MAEGGEVAVVPSECHGFDECECEEIEFVDDVVLFTFFMLFLGLVAKHLLRGIPIPYTGMLLIMGLAFGFVHTSLRPDKGDLLCESRLEACCEEHTVWRRGYRYLGRGIEGWVSIEPELLLLIHLPALIFASAFTLDFHITKRNIWQILILAGPGVAVGIALTATVAKYVFPYDWCWPKALMFGAMLSATDPVAVVALLKEVGASAILGTVIEGESLFNDGTAFVFFLLFRDLIRWTTSCNNDECHNAFAIDPRLCPCLDDPLLEVASEGGEGAAAMESVAGEGGRRLLLEEARTCTNYSSDFTAIRDFPDRTVGDSIEFFARLALGGPVVGIAYGVAASTWINFVFNDMVVEVAITFITAYLTYYTAEVLLEMSGVLSVVGLGITMAVLARPRLSPKAHEPMEVFWEMVEYFANTMIFVYAGVQIAVALKEEVEEDFISSTEWGYGFLLFLFLQVIRLVTVIICYPFMIMTGYYIQYKEALVMVWGGLRGAVGLALGLIVQLDFRRIDPKFRALVIFYMGFIAALTIIVNGSTMGQVLALLGVTKPKPEKLEVLLHVVKELEKTGEGLELEPDPLMGDPDIKLVKQLTSLDTSKIVPSRELVCRVMKDAENQNHPAALALDEHLSKSVDLDKLTLSKTQGMLSKVSHFVVAAKKPSSRFSFHHKSRRMGEEITTEMLVLDFRSRLLTGVKSEYGHLNEEGVLDPDQHYSLKESADEALDAAGKPLSDWRHLEHALSFQFWRKAVNLGESVFRSEWKIKGLGKPVQNFLDQRFFEALEHSAIMAKTFIHAHQEACHSLQEYIEFVKKEQQANEAEEGAAAVIEDASKRVLRESLEEQEKATEFLQNMRRAYPEVTLAIKTKRTAWEVLHNKLKYVDELLLSGLVERKEAQALKLAVEQKIKHLMYHPPKMGLPDSSTLLRKHPLFSEMDEEVFKREVLPSASLRLYALGEKIFEIGEVSTELSLVVRGVVRVEAAGHAQCAVQQGTGAMVGVSEVMLNERRSRSLVAETAVVEVYQINAETFRDVVQKYERVRRRAWQMAGAFLTLKSPWGQFGGKTHAELQSLFRQSTLVELEEGDKVCAETKSFLVFGALERPGEGEERAVVVSPSPLAKFITYTAKSTSKILNLQELPRKSLARVASMAAGGAVAKRPAIAQLSMRPTALTRAASMGPRAIGMHGIAAALTDIAEGSGPSETAAAAAAAVAAVDAEREAEEGGEKVPLTKAESAPSWRLRQAADSADRQLREEAQRSRMRPLVTRASTGVTPGQV